MNNKTKLVIFVDKKNITIGQTVYKHFKENNKIDAVFVQQESDLVDDMLHCYKTNIANNKNARMVAIDDYGILPFMVLSKLKGAVVAIAEDEHTAKMTMMHNDANVLSIGNQIVGDELIISIVDYYLNASFEGGRHIVRLDMLTKLLEKEEG